MFLPVLRRFALGRLLLFPTLDGREFLKICPTRAREGGGGEAGTKKKIQPQPRNRASRRRHLLVTVDTQKQTEEKNMLSITILRETE